MHDYDIIIIGGGPAGMTAALYALRNGKSVFILEKNGFGGQMTYSPKIENYPGRLSLSGNELADDMLNQIIEQGAELGFERASEVRRGDGVWTVVTNESEYSCLAVIIAAGVKHRMLGLDGEEELIGSGISFCAVCDGEFFRGKPVAVAGGGNSALQEALLLSDLCPEVTVIQDLDHLTGEKKSQDILFSRPNVNIVTGAVVSSLISRDGKLSGIIYHRTDTDELVTLDCEGLFVAVGLIPENGDFAGVLNLNEYGYAVTGDDMAASGSLGGIFAAGDCRSKQVRQITTAVSDGAVAAVSACRYIDSLGGPADGE